MLSRCLLLALSSIILVACSGDASIQTDEEDEALTNFDQFQKHNLSVVNAYRAKKGIAPLKLAASLSSFALAGSKELEKDHSPHAHFIAAAKSGALWHDGFKTTAGENQGDPHGWPELATDPTKNEDMQIDAIQKMMYAEGPGTGEAHGHYENMMNGKFHRLGVGLVRATGGKLYLTNDFSD
jgi:uncharacterized protein YkwD